MLPKLQKGEYVWIKTKSVNCWFTFIVRVDAYSIGPFDIEYSGRVYHTTVKHTGFYYRDYQRHATPEEIAALPA